MSNDLVTYTLPVDPEALNRALMVGDLSKLSPADRTNYYLALCASNRLNPLTRPFIVMKTQDNSMQWYPTIGCAEQLRKRDKVSTRILGRELTPDGMYIITVEASTPDGRTEQSQGIVALAEPRLAWRKNAAGEQVKTEERTSSGDPIMVPLYGKARENAMMRCESKAKRRVTFALCGLGMADRDPEAGQPVRFDPPTGALEEPARAPEDVAAEHAALDAMAWVPPPVGVEGAQRHIADMFDRSTGEPTEGAGVPASARD